MTTKIIGLTGGICCGKSTVSKTFIKFGIPVVDADIVARQVVEIGTQGLEQIVNCFGSMYLRTDGTLNREALGRLVFSDPQAMKNLNKIMAPLITNEAEIQFRKLSQEGHELIIWDAALIVEMGHADDFRPLIVVHCPRDTQVERLMSRNNLTRSEAMARIEAQMPVENKLKLADYQIDTSGTIEESVKQTEVIIHKLRANK